jgi:glucosamine-phosphate N-acetyltransferase
MSKFEIRPLYGRDFDSGFLELLAQLSPVELIPDSARKLFAERFKAQVNTWVALDDGRVIGTASLFVEPKFIHCGGKVGHVEDVVVDAAYRSRGVGQELLATLEREARSQGCYKMVLDCSEHAVAFYERCGFYSHERQMRRDLAKHIAASGDSTLPSRGFIG